MFCYNSHVNQGHNQLANRILTSFAQSLKDNIDQYFLKKKLYRAKLAGSTFVWKHNKKKTTTKLYMLCFLSECMQCTSCKETVHWSGLRPGVASSPAIPVNSCESFDILAPVNKREHVYRKSTTAPRNQLVTRTYCTDTQHTTGNGGTGLYERDMI